MKKIKRILGYFLIITLVLSNLLNYNAHANYKEEFDILTETISAGTIAPETVDVTISHIDVDTNEKLLEDEIISKVINEEVISINFKKDIEGYTFKEAIPEKITVSKDNKEIKIYYKKEEVIPEEKYEDVIIHHYLIDSTEKVAEDTILEDIKVGTTITAFDYVLSLNEMKFNSSVPQTLIVIEGLNEIIIYYEKDNIVEPTDKTDVLIQYVDEEGNKLLEDKIIKDVALNSVIKGRDYIININGYEFKYSFPEILEVRLDNNIIKLTYKKQEVPEITTTDVIINHYEQNTENKLCESVILNSVEVGTILNSNEYKKDIEGYIYAYAEYDKVTINKDNNIVNLYYTKESTVVPPPIEKIDVVINHYEKGTNNKIYQSDIVNEVEIGTILISSNYQKNIDGYTFANPEFTEVAVDKNNNTINLYYNKDKVDTEEPEGPEEPEEPESPEDSDLPQTGGVNFIWIGYILLLAGIIIKNSSKKEIN